METGLHCLFCDSQLKDGDTHCHQCGMAVPLKHPLKSYFRRANFRIWFILIALFCVFMMWYLPR